MQVPIWQTSPVEQVLPHVPQLVTSVATLVQTPEHSSGWMLGQMQAPLPHNFPPVHTWKQIPQFCLSLSRATQMQGGAWVHTVNPAGHSQPHLPASHQYGLQSTPHWPQWKGLFSVFTHSPLQSVSPLGHWQLASRHRKPLAQRFAHPPQCRVSLEVSTHWPLQSTKGEEQPQVPCRQVNPFSVAHRFPHPPQLFMSEAGSTHDSPQSSMPDGHTAVSPVLSGGAASFRESCGRFMSCTRASRRKASGVVAGCRPQETPRRPAVARTEIHTLAQGLPDVIVSRGVRAMGHLQD